MKHKTKNIGIFGGTFNPIHNTHLYIANEFTKQMELDYCYFVPTYISPFKINNKEMQLNPDDRLNMIELAISNNPQFKIETYELDQKTVSYTINTIKFFSNKFKNDKLFFLIGSDQAEKFNLWKQWKEILNFVQLCIVLRGSDSINKQKINDIFPANAKPVWIEIQTSDISSSQIRNLINSKKSISGLVPQDVEKYIKENKLYL